MSLLGNFLLASLADLKLDVVLRRMVPPGKGRQVRYSLLQALSPMNRLAGMAQPYSLEALFLCVLLRGPNNGTGILAQLAQLDADLHPAAGATYPALRRLKEEGLATSKDVPPPADRGGRPRRFYALTPKGRRRANQLSRFYGALVARELEGMSQPEQKVVRS